MGANNRVDCLDRLANIPLLVVSHSGLIEARMGGFQAMELLSVQGRQRIIGGDGGEVQGVATGFGCVESQKGGRSHTITLVKLSVRAPPSLDYYSHLIGHVGMPLDAADIILDFVVYGASPRCITISADESSWLQPRVGVYLKSL